MCLFYFGNSQIINSYIYLIPLLLSSLHLDVVWRSDALIACSSGSNFFEANLGVTRAVGIPSQWRAIIPL